MSPVEGRQSDLIWDAAWLVKCLGCPQLDPAAAAAGYRLLGHTLARQPDRREHALAARTSQPAFIINHARVWLSNRQWQIAAMNFRLWAADGLVSGCWQA